MSDSTDVCKDCPQVKSGEIYVKGLCCDGCYIVRGLQVPLKVYLLEITNGTDTTKVKRK